MGIYRKVFLGEPGYLFIAKENFDLREDYDVSMEENLATFAAILRFCRLQNIDTRIFITPAHVFHLNFWQELGYKNTWHTFHHDLVAMNFKIAKESNEVPFPLWGFNQTQGVVDEPIPRRKQADASWFRDGVHYSAALGTQIMNSMWGEKSLMGVLLTEETVKPYLVDVDRIVTNFRNKSPRILQKSRDQICRSIFRQASNRKARLEDVSHYGCTEYIDVNLSTSRSPG